MAKVLVAYGSKMGGTAGIAERVADTLRGRGHQVTLAPAGEVPRGTAWDAAVVGSGLYAGHWRREAVRLLEAPRPARARSRGGCGSSTAGPWATSTPTTPSPCPRRCRRLAERLGAEDVVTFGGRFRAEDASGLIAKAMAQGQRAGRLAAPGPRRGLGQHHRRELAG